MNLSFHTLGINLSLITASMGKYISNFDKCGQIALPEGHPCFLSPITSEGVTPLMALTIDCITKRLDF